jgi:hypothetical protein
MHLAFPERETENLAIPSSNKSRDTPEQTNSQDNHHQPDNAHSLQAGVPLSLKPNPNPNQNQNQNQKVSTQTSPTSHTDNNSSNRKRKATPLKQEQQEPPSTKREQHRASTQAGQLPTTDGVLGT